jgi:hypothetical protein
MVMSDWATQQMFIRRGIHTLFLAQLFEEKKSSYCRPGSASHVILTCFDWFKKLRLFLDVWNRKIDVVVTRWFSLTQLFEEKKSSYCRPGSASGSVKFFVKSPFLKNFQRYPFETWNTCSLSKEEPITRQITLRFVSSPWK